MFPIAMKQRSENDPPQSNRLSRIDAPIIQVQIRPYFEKVYQPKRCDKKQWWYNAVFEINFLFQLNDGLKMIFFTNLNDFNV